MIDITKLQRDITDALTVMGVETGGITIGLMRSMLFVYTAEADFRIDGDRADMWYNRDSWHLASLVIHPYAYNGLGFHKCRWDFMELKEFLDARGWRCANTLGLPLDAPTRD